MRFARLLLTTLILSAFASAAPIMMSVAQLTDFIRSSITELHYPDRQVAQYLHSVKLTEHLDGDRLESLEAMGAGPRTREALEALSTSSKTLPAPPPVVEAPKPELLPVKPPPDSIEQKRIIDGRARLRPHLHQAASQLHLHAGDAALLRPQRRR